jgi:hypothetical protein
MYVSLIISCSVSVSTYMSGQANSNICTTYCRGKFDPRTGHEGPEGDLVLGGWPTLHPGCFTPPGNRLGTHRTGGWVGPRIGLEGYGIAYSR